MAGYAGVLANGIPAPTPAPTTANRFARAASPPAVEPTDPALLRTAVSACLRGMARRIAEALPEALASAPRVWDRADNLVVLLDEPRSTEVARLWRRLHAVACSATLSAQERAVAVEGLLALHTAYELTLLHERKLSSLIRMRVRSGSEELLPGGRPFLDLAAALEEAANAWAST